MRTVNSVSGGKTSAYLALHYPADFNVFSIVLSEHLASSPKDKSLSREVNQRLEKYTGISDSALFISSREQDSTLRAVLDLEQKLGTEINWVCALEGQHSNRSISDPVNGWSPRPLTFERMLLTHRALPNRRGRFCTIELKLTAIFFWTYLYAMESPQDIVDMRIGFRADESHRAERLIQRCPKFNAAISCKVDARLKRNQRNLKKIEWRVPSFPLIYDEITSDDIKNYWAKSGDIHFPKVSNCSECFFHTSYELAINAVESPERFNWAIEQENLIGAKWDKEKDLEAILSDPSAYPEVKSRKTKLACSCTD